MKQKAKYKLNDAAVQDLIKLDQLELAVKTITESYNELRDSVWARIRKSYYLEEGKKYRFIRESKLLVEVQ